MLCIHFPFIINAQGILVVVWQLVDSSISGVFVAAVVLDNVTNFGQVWAYYKIISFSGMH